MRPRLASLALLLLGLCRPSTGAAAPTGWAATVTAQDSDVTFSKATKDAQADKFIAGYIATTDLTKLEAIFGNSLHALMLKGAGKFDALPDYYKKALVNGVLCELAEPDIGKNIANALYTVTDGKKPAAEIRVEKDLAKANHGIDCDSTDAAKKDADLCTVGAEKPLIFVLAKKQFTGPKTACLKEVIEEAKNFGKKGLWYSLTDESAHPEGPEPTTAVEALGMITQNESPDMANLFCDASDPAVLAITEKLYASHGLLWTDEAAFFLQQGSTFDKECEKDEVKNSDLGKCMCSKKTGKNVCAVVNTGTLFKNKGYLDCAPTPAKFDSAKKDSVAADFVAYSKSGIIPSSNPAPGPGAPTGAPGGNETTTAATGGAATSSLLLAPLAAAAAALLLL